MHFLLLFPCMYLVLMFSLFLAMYFERNFHMAYPRRFMVLLLCVVANAAIQILLQVAFIGVRISWDICARNFPFASLAASASCLAISASFLACISVFIIVLVCITAIISLVQFHDNNKRFQTILPAIAVIVLLSGGIANVIMEKASISFTNDKSVCPAV